MNLTEQARKARNEYRRKWAKENPEKIKAQQLRYWMKKAREQAAQEEADDTEKE